MADSLLIALSALSAQQRAMEVTSHNIANAATPGYSRQRADLTTPDGDTTRPGPTGRGVVIDAIRRVADSVVNDRLRQSNSESGRLGMLIQNLEAVEASFDEPGENGLSAGIDRLFSQFQDLSNNPESTALRSTVVQELQGFTNHLSTLSARVTGLLDDVRSAYTATVGEINQITTQIAALNQQIRIQVNTGGQPNDLMDRRDSLLQDLAKRIQVNVRTDLTDQSVLIDSNGRLLVGRESASLLSVKGVTGSGEALDLLAPGNFQMDVLGGQLAALDELQRTVVPGLVDRLNTMATSMVRQLNGIHSVSTSQAMVANGWTSEAVLSPDQTFLDLDDVRLAQTVAGGVGIATPYAPSFTDADGASVPRNLTINVLDTATKVARKYVLRYDPGSGPIPATRSAEDLVAAINTGKGGGFTLYPAGNSGIPNVSARLASVSDGFKVQLQGASGTSIDFSRSLDLQPAASAWTSPQVTVAGIETTVPPLHPSSRMTVRVNGANVEALVRDPASGAETLLGSVAIPANGTSVMTPVPGITINVPAGTWRSGDAFTFDTDATGGVVQSGSLVANTSVRTATWTASDATVSIKGRYTNTIGFDPAQPWSMRVVTAGVIGAKAGTAVPNNPPLVEFTYRAGTPDAPTVRTVQKILDDTLPPGTPVAIADGVYATFSAGVLSQVDNRADFIVDGDPDQAGLLPALGINSLFSGSDAATMRIADGVAADPTQFNVSSTRAQGDNTALIAMADLRGKQVMEGGFTIEDYYQAGVAELGVRIQGGKNQTSIQDSLRSTLENQRNLVSGVNIDEEVGALILQQQAYAAAAKIVTFSRENIQTLLDLLR
jgi:flagellar hook-associated protein 1 FlgK